MKLCLILALTLAVVSAVAMPSFLEVSTSTALPQDVINYETSKIEHIRSTLVDLRDRYKRNSERLTAFRSALLSALQIDVSVETIPHDERLSMDSSFIQIDAPEDLDDKLDDVLAMIHECDTISDANTQKLKDVRGSLTSFIEIGTEIETEKPKRQGHRAGSMASYGFDLDHDAAPPKEGSAVRSEAVNSKLDSILSTMQHFILNNQEAGRRVHTVDKIWSIEEDIVRESKEYTDAISMLRGQFISMVEVSTETKPIHHTKHAHHHTKHAHHHAKKISEEEAFLTQGLNAFNQDALVTDHTPQQNPMFALESNALQMGEGAAITPSAVLSKDIGLEEHQKRLQDALTGFETLKRKMDMNFERVRELKRELDVF